jgi:hypothetical protein
MHESDAQAWIGRLEHIEKRNRRLVALTVVVLIVVIGGAGVSAWWIYREKKSMRASLRDIEFSQVASQYERDTNFASPDVGVIQFLKNGYSIHFDIIRYTQEGLLLSGRIGNPKQLSVSTLTLGFSVQPYPYGVRDKWEKDGSDGFYPYFGNYEIGKAQAGVTGTLFSGTTLPFSVTIPNVKQTKDPIQIAISFSGERYGYLDGTW